MARSRNILTAKGAAALSKSGRHSDGGSLYLAIDGEGATARRRWLYLFHFNGKRREMGLGGFPVVSLADARRARDDAERLVREGIDPIAQRDAARVAQSKKMTFGEAADALIETKGPGWRNAKHRAQWKMTLEKYAAPLRPRPVDEIDTTAILAVLTPLWQAKPGNRLALARTHRSGPRRGQGARPSIRRKPRRVARQLVVPLAQRSKFSRGHHAAMAYADVPAFVAKLRKREAVAALALEFCILTAARSARF